jgi:hypothetical protein
VRFQGDTRPIIKAVDSDGLYDFIDYYSAGTEVFSINAAGTITVGAWHGSTIGIAYGGTNATTANAALNNLLPTQTSNSGKVLSTNGTNASWVAAGGGSYINNSTTLQSSANFNISGSARVQTGLDIGTSNTNIGAGFAVGLTVGTGLSIGGDYAVALGNGATANADYAFAQGGSDASGMNAIAMGPNALASGDYSIAMGQSNHATNANSVAFGFQTTASGDTSTSLGSLTLASGSLSLATGNQTTASGSVSTAMGASATAGHTNSFCWSDGQATTATSASYQFVIGASGGVHILRGNMLIDTAGNGLGIKGGSNAKIGTATLLSGTVTVSTTAVTSSSLIFLTNQAPSLGGGAVGALSIGAVIAGASFVINSSNVLDNSVIGWIIIEKT